jgi:hypothetical protein
MLIFVRAGAHTNLLLASVTVGRVICGAGLC